MKKLLLPLIFGFIFFAGILFIGNEITTNFLAPEDSSALFGGKLESGYPSAGYLIGYRNGSPEELCGLVYISPTQALSAAHCFDKSEDFYNGEGQFVANSAQLAKVNAFFQSPGWDKRTSYNDMAIINLNEIVSLNPDEYGQIVSPEAGCNYEVVAYGRTENDGVSLGMDRPRKSATICITTIEDRILYATSSDGGICLGDSGSPVYEKGTNRIVGIISAILRPRDNSEACFIANTAIINRADRNSDFLSRYTNTAVLFASGEPTPAGPSFSLSELPVTAANAVEDLKRQNLYLPALVVLFVVVFMMFIFAVSKLLRE